MRVISATTACVFSILLTACTASESGRFVVDDNGLLEDGNILECGRLGHDLYDCTQRRQSDNAATARGIYRATSSQRWSLLREQALAAGGDPIELGLVRIVHRWKGRVLYAACVEKLDPDTGERAANLAVAQYAADFLAGDGRDIDGATPPAGHPILFRPDSCSFPLTTGPLRGQYPDAEVAVVEGGSATTDDGVFWVHRQP